jgi:phosphomannomutase
MNDLMLSVSGLRGIVGTSLTSEIIAKYVSAFAHFAGHGKIVIGRDSRTSGEFISRICTGALQAMGVEVIDLGIVPTPTVQMLTEMHGADGGMVITASHNPAQWNGLKFVAANGMFLPPDKAEQLFSIAREGSYQGVSFDRLGNVLPEQGAIDMHIRKIMQLEFVNKEGLQKRKFKVVIDTVNGAGGLIMPKLLEEMGCELIVLNGEANGLFAHNPEPLAEHLSELSKSVREHGADLGIATDPDVDRCALIDEQGNAIGEELTLAIATKFMLARQMGHVVTNLSTSRMIDDLARYYNCPIHRTPVGEIHVAAKMREVNAVIGGEGNGGVILPQLHLGRDAPVAAAIVLQALLEFGQPMSELCRQLPKYAISKHKVDTSGLATEKIYAALEKHYSDAEVSKLDGVKFDFDEHWLHLRKSNTEPVVRIIAEARSADAADKHCFEVAEIIRGLH